MVIEYYIHSSNAGKDGKPEKCFSYVAFKTRRYSSFMELLQTKLQATIWHYTPIELMNNDNYWQGSSTIIADVYIWIPFSCLNFLGFPFAIAY